MKRKRHHMGTGRLFGIASLSAGIIFAVFFLVRDIVHDEIFSPGSVNISAAPRTDEASAGSVLSETDSQEGRSETAGDADFLRRLLGASGNGIDIRIDGFPRHGIESEHIDSNSVTSRTIRDRTIEGIDIDKGTDLDIGSLNVSSDVDIAGILGSGGLTVSGDADILGDISAAGLDISGAAGFGDALVLSRISAPSSTVDHLYNVGGDLYWAGNVVGGASTGNWATDGTSVWRANGNVGIGTASPNGLFHLGQMPGALQTTPTLAFGDGDTGFYESSDDQLRMSLGGSAIFNFSTSGLAASANGPFFQLGIASAVFPTLVPKNTDTNTGIGSAGDDILSLVAGGTNGLNVISSGYVGIGTTSPGVKLEVNGDVAFSGNNRFIFGGYTAGEYITTTSVDHPIQFFGSYQERMRINNNGNVGIGTTTPGVKLEVNGNIKLSNAGNFLQIDDVILQESSNQAVLKGADGLLFQTYDTDWVTKLIINNDGNVGIGTANPGAKLQVAGTDGGTTQSIILGTTGANYWKISALAFNATKGKYDFQIGGNSFGTGDILLNPTNGNIGIGTTSPSAKLEVSGLSVNSGTSDIAVITGSSVTTGFYDSLAFRQNTTTTGARITSGNAGSYYGFLAFETSQQTSAGHVTVEAMRINNNGNVGIGTMSPDTKLHLSGTGAAPAYLTWERPDGAIGSRNWMSGIANNHRWLLGLGNDSGVLTSELFTVLSSGNVGIGTTSPGQKFEVLGGRSRFSLDNSGIIQSYRPGNLLNAGNIHFQGDNSVSAITDYSYISSAITSNVSGLESGELSFYTKNGGVISEKLRMASNGNVGIGTTSPGAKLHVVESISGVTPSNNYDTVFFESNGRAGITLGTPNTTNSMLAFADPENATAGFVNYSHSTNVLSFGTSGSEKLWIDTLGSVGIGTASPAAKLDIAGGLVFSAGVVSVPATSFGGIISSDGSVGTYPFNEYGNLILASRSNGTGRDIVFQTGTTLATRAVIDRSGNVGIGTTSPGAKLDLRDGVFVLTDADVAHGMTSAGFGVTTNSYGALQPSSGTDGGLWVNGLSDADATGLHLQGIIGNNDPTDTTAAVLFRAGKRDASGSSWSSLGNSETAYQFRNYSTNLVTILGSGNVGIGTTSPGAKLDVNGSVTTNGSYYLTSGANTARIWYDGVLKLDNGANTVRILGSSQLDGSVYLNNGYLYGPASAGLRIHASNSGTHAITTFMSNNSAERMRIDAAGNVGIGDTTPAALLTVGSGDLFQVDSSGLVLAPIGSATAPSYSFVGDTGTGFYRLTGGRLGLALSGIQAADIQAGAFEILSNISASRFDQGVTIGASYSSSAPPAQGLLVQGNVGIGTTSPTALLHLSNANPKLYFTETDRPTDEKTWKLTADTGNFYFTTRNDADGGGVDWLMAKRGTGTAVDSVNFPSSNVGIGTTNQFGSGTGVLALGNATTNPTTTLTNAALLYASGGEMYVYDAAGNATQISPHDDMGLWHYNSTNTRTGKTLEVSMELLTKDLDRILGGGYVYENGDRLFSGENRIDSLSLRTDEYATTLGAFRASVDENLLSVSASLSDFGKDIDELAEKIEGLDAKMVSTEESLEDRIVVLENGVTSRDTQISALMDFYSALDLGNVLLLDIDGNLTIPSGDLLIRNIEAQGTIRAEDVEAEDGITAGGIVAGAAIAAGEESSGSGTLKAGDDRTVIDTEYANEDAKIFITIKGSPHGKSLYVDDIEEGESFTVKVDGDVSDKDIDFFWFVLR